MLLFNGEKRHCRDILRTTLAGPSQAATSKHGSGDCGRRRSGAHSETLRAVSRSYYFYDSEDVASLFVSNFGPLDSRRAVGAEMFRDVWYRTDTVLPLILLVCFVD